MPGYKVIVLPKGQVVGLWLLLLATAAHACRGLNYFYLVNSQRFYVYALDQGPDPMILTKINKDHLFYMYQESKRFVSNRQNCLKSRIIILFQRLV